MDGGGAFSPRARAASDAGPLLRPLITRQLHPSLNSTQHRLGIGLPRINLLCLMARQQAIAITYFGRLHRGRVGSQLIEHGPFPVLVPDIVALEHGPPLELSIGIAIRELRPFLDADVKHAPNIALLHVLARLPPHRLAGWTAGVLEGEGPNVLGWTVNGEDTGGQAWYDLTLAVHPQNPDQVHVGGVNLWGSEDGGGQWQCAAHWYAGADLPYLHADQHGLKYLEDGRMLVANDGGAFVFDPATASSADKSAGLAITQAYRLDLDPQAIDRLLVGTQDNGTFMKHEGAWEHVRGGDGVQCSFHGALSGVVYA